MQSDSHQVNIPLFLLERSDKLCERTLVLLSGKVICRFDNISESFAALSLAEPDHVLDREHADILIVISDFLPHFGVDMRVLLHELDRLLGHTRVKQKAKCFQCYRHYLPLLANQQLDEGVETALSQEFQHQVLEKTISP